ncbi:sodium/hydrogen exchanger family protein [Pelomyxa schiedti]|nr:sodium/hydrogen exchanger family protein [Pelomyxa schiedti]
MSCSLSSISSSHTEGGETGAVAGLVELCCLALIVSCGCYSFMSYFLPKRYRIWNIPVFLFGIALAPTTLRVMEITTHLDPEIIVLVFLPPILFVAGLGINWHVFKKLLWQCLLLAGPAVIISATVIGVIGKYANSIKGHAWSWSEALLLGAALSATDPVATIATVKKLGASPKLSVLIEGEALLNDGTAYVLFFVIQGVLIHNSFSFGTTVWAAVRLTGGGPLFGGIAAFLCYYWLRTIHSKPVLEITIVVTAVFSTMFLSELIGTSGVLAVVTFGLYFAYQGKLGFSPNATEPNFVFWEQLEFIINSLIFFFTGDIVFHDLYHSTAWDWFNMVLTFLSITVARGIALLLCSPVLIRTGYGFDFKKFFMLWSAGLRGGVSLSIALFVSANGNYEAPFRREFVTQVVGTVLLTSLINGIFAKPIYQFLNFPKSEPKSVHMFAMALAHMNRESKDLREDMMKDPVFKHVNWELVDSAVPIIQVAPNQVVMELTDWISFWKLTLANMRDDNFQEDPTQAYSMGDSIFVEEGEINEETIEARELLVRHVRADIIEQHETMFRVTPSNLITLTSVVEGTSEQPDKLFGKTWQFLFRQFHPRFTCFKFMQRLACTSVFRFLTIYFAFSRVNWVILRTQSILKAFRHSIETVEKHTGVSFQHQLEVVQRDSSHELHNLRQQQHMTYNLAVNSIAVSLILQHRKAKLDSLLEEGFIDENTRNIIVHAGNQVAKKIVSLVLVWYFRDILINGNSSIMFQREVKAFTPTQVIVSHNSVIPPTVKKEHDTETGNAHTLQHAPVEMKVLTPSDQEHVGKSTHTKPKIAEATAPKAMTTTTTTTTTSTTTSHKQKSDAVEVTELSEVVIESAVATDTN